MAPKKSRTTSVKTRSLNKPVEPVSNDTSYDYNAEILNYQKQIKDLQQEVIDYKNQVLALQAEIDILRTNNQNSMRISLQNDQVKFGLMDKRVSDIRNGKPYPSSEKKVKGCSCKGTCSNKICGCVKKNVFCQSICRCNDVQCKNQEPENDNYKQAELTNDDQTALERLESLTLNQEALHASKKKAKRSIFSPDDKEIIKEDKKYPNNSNANETKRKLFTQYSNETVDINTDPESLSRESDGSDSNKSLNNFNESEASVSKTPVSKYTRSLINNKNDVNHMIDNDEQKEYFEKDCYVNKLREKHCISDGKQILPENMKVENNETMQESNVIVENETSSNEDVYLAKYFNKSGQNFKKSKSVSPDSYKECKSMQSKYILSNESININANNNNKLSVLNDLQQFSKLQTDRPILCYQSVDDANNKENIRTFQQESQEKFESNTNENKDLNLNPMAPKHELQRSPINAVIPVLNKRFSSPKMELAMAEVDWEQHQSKLITCKICKRKFFPHRIDKHLTSCKGI